MAERRMFAKTIIDSDAFLDMSLSAQALYFHLSMRGDDEGFVNNPKKIQRMIGASDDDAKILVAKKFIIPFESGIVVIKHWKIHNYIRGDRLVETKYKEERSLLELDENGAYTSIVNDDQPALSAKDMRKHAYEVSSLPYSFEYKIRHAFTGQECPVCGCTMTHENNLVQPTIQHNIPISKGGEHELGNISVICRSCNTSIRDKETGELNSREVAETWDKICKLESHGIDWFKNTTLLWQSSDGQVTDISQPNGSIGKVRLDKVRLDKVSIKDNADVSDDTSPKEIALDKEKKKIDYTPIIHEAIDYLNQKANTRYKYTSKNTITHIKARVNEGFTVEDFKQVIDKKCHDWGNDAKMSKYLRPETLFGTKFEGYLNEREKTNGNIQRTYRESQQKSQGNADAEWDEQLRNWCARQKSEPRPWDV